MTVEIRKIDFFKGGFCYIKAVTISKLSIVTAKTVFTGQSDEHRRRLAVGEDAEVSWRRRGGQLEKTQRSAGEDAEVSWRRRGGQPERSRKTAGDRTVAEIEE